MIEKLTPVTLARHVFRSFGQDGNPCVVLHHFDFETGGDIDFCADFPSSSSFLNELGPKLIELGWNVAQVLNHEQSGAYIVAFNESAIDDVVLFDFCADYRVRGHKILSVSDMQEDPRVLTWGGLGSSPLIELTYRFVKSAAKKKPVAEVVQDLGDLWQSCGGGFQKWLHKCWSVELDTWDEPAVQEALRALNVRLKKRRRSFAELKLKMGRVLKPSGLILECSVSEAENLREILSPFFRDVVIGYQNILPILGSTLVIVQEGEVSVLKQCFLTKIGCWLRSEDRDEIVGYLASRTSHYQGWTRQNA
ncbi:hypothetical protein OAE11_01330 [Akkermansiaceae bacterium]|nr:hypothetical protein [Akkermansiaceae bacterium]MDB4271673.1 hypothetical protein [Akkermansiaceae bacterium]MDB4626867.1 hypothetical protein [Akkermansiaceae bacterium]MDB4820185.1 hypothetical protein [Akkermansiaceae bacterium]